MPPFFDDPFQGTSPKACPGVRMRFRRYCPKETRWRSHPRLGAFDSCTVALETEQNPSRPPAEPEESSDATTATRPSGSQSCCLSNLLLRRAYQIAMFVCVLRLCSRPDREADPRNRPVPEGSGPGAWRSKHRKKTHRGPFAASPLSHVIPTPYFDFFSYFSVSFFTGLRYLIKFVLTRVASVALSLLGLTPSPFVGRLLTTCRRR